MERVGRVATVCNGVGERADDLAELHDGAGPAVGHDERPRARLRRRDMEEVNIHPVDLRPELRDPVEACLARAPVVVLLPVVAQVAQVGQRHALGPVVHRLRLRPAGLP